MEVSRLEAGSLGRGHCCIPGKKGGGGALSRGSGSGDKDSWSVFWALRTGEQVQPVPINRGGRSLGPVAVSCLRPGRPKVRGARAGVCNIQPGNTSLHPGPLPPAQCYLQTLPEGKGKTLDLAQSRLLSVLGRGHWSREKRTDSGPPKERKSGTSPLDCASQVGKGSSGRRQVSRHVHPLGR